MKYSKINDTQQILTHNTCAGMALGRLQHQLLFQCFCPSHLPLLLVIDPILAGMMAVLPKMPFFM